MRRPGLRLHHQCTLIPYKWIEKRINNLAKVNTSKIFSCVGWSMHYCHAKVHMRNTWWILSYNSSKKDIPIYAHITSLPPKSFFFYTISFSHSLTHLSNWSSIFPKFSVTLEAIPALYWVSAQTDAEGEYWRRVYWVVLKVYIVTFCPAGEAVWHSACSQWSW